MCFQVFSKNGVACNLSTRRVTDLDENEKKAVVDLLIRNMKALYEQSNWGWNEKNKRDEMLEDSAWYLLAKNEEGKICGFSHFRYDMDYDDEVLYVYEVSKAHSEIPNKKLLPNDKSFSIFTNYLSTSLLG